jgi:Serine protease inhibitor
MRRKSFKTVTVKILLLTMIFVSGLQAQEIETIRKITGTVTDNLGNPVEGANIAIQGTGKGGVSDFSGNYSINISSQNDVLEFSYIGFQKQEITVGKRDTINVVMDEGEIIEPAKPVMLTQIQREKADADNSFAFKMFNEVSKLEGSNTFFSPFSLNMAMGMIYNGSSGNTRDELVKSLGIENFSESDINKYYKKISQSLMEIDPVTDLVVANSIWYRNSFTVKAPFIEISKKYFDADVLALDFNNSNAAGMINKWCSDKTRNKFGQIVSNPLPNGLMMYLINALYFKSKWEKGKEFEKSKTKSDYFTKSNSEKIKVNMMEQTTSLSYYADEHLQCVELPYGNNAFSMIAILPSENKDLNKLIEYLCNDKWGNIVNSMQQERVWLKLPRFRIECNFRLIQPLMNLGIEQIFKGGFENISDTPFWVSEIRQKTFVEVNEEGTEASALTTVFMIGYAGLSKPKEPIHFFADRPFLFLIREKSTGVILFVGRVDEPHE